MTIRSNPPGALVYVDDYQLGTTPVSHDFIYYGTRKIRLVKDGYETLTVRQPFPIPWYEIFPLDFVTENLIPWEVRDERVRRASLEEQGFSAPQARARREAERDLVALLLAHPEFGQDRVLLDDGSSLPVSEIATPEAFLDPECRAVVDAVHPWLEEGRPFAIGDALAEIRWEPAKSRAADLVLLGERRCASENTRTATLQAAVDAFERIRRSRRPVSTPLGRTNRVPTGISAEQDALAARLQAIRSRGRDPTAFGRLPGSAPSRANGPPET